MITIVPQPDDPPGVVAFLSEALDVVNEALDDAISFADLTMDGLPPDAHMYAHLVRYRVSTLLKEDAKSAKSWFLVTMLNSGIAVGRGPFIMRLAKTASGGPPAPGRNGARRNYWQQHQVGRFDFESPGRTGAAGANLLLEWGISNTRAPVLALSKPVAYWDYQGEPDLEWREPLKLGPHSPGFDGSDEAIGDEDGEQEDGTGSTP